jgi:hypothetical protein
MTTLKLAKSGFSRLGLALASAYVLVTAFCVLASNSANADPKGSYVLLQLPIALQGSLLHALGLGDFLRGFSWTEAYFALGLPTVIALYAIGHLATVKI